MLSSLKVKRILWVCLFLFIAMNAVAFIHAYKFTHFSTRKTTRTKDPKELSAIDKATILLSGIDNPRPTGQALPQYPYEKITVKSSAELACWNIPVKNAIGTVILFHGYAGEKSSLLTRAEEFRKLGYTTFLVDFMGSGDSGGKATSIGYREARQVKDCFDYIQAHGENHIMLFGTSMGSAAILKALHDYDFTPQGIILECPFGSLYTTVCARFRLMHVPTFPMAGLLSFWGGVQHGYWAFSHNPAQYAEAVDCPALLLFGEQDDRVTLEETNLIYANLKGRKTLKTYPNAGHALFTEENKDNWTIDVAAFINSIP